MGSGAADARPPAAAPAPAGAPPAGAPAAGAPAAEANTNGVVFWPVAAFVLLADQCTKGLARAALDPPGFPHPVVGDWLRFTLVFNPGAAFDLHLGPLSRWIFLTVALVVLRVLWRMYRRTRDRDNARVVALALLSAGALGNAIDRVTSADGVVDFLDVGVGARRWPVFNLADVAVTTGAGLLAWLLLRRGDGAEAPAPAASPTPPSRALAADAADAS